MIEEITGPQREYQRMIEEIAGPQREYQRMIEEITGPRLALTKHARLMDQITGPMLALTDHAQLMGQITGPLRALTEHAGFASLDQAWQALPRIPTDDFLPRVLAEWPIDVFAEPRSIHPDLPDEVVADALRLTVRCLTCGAVREWLPTEAGGIVVPPFCIGCVEMSEEDPSGFDMTMRRAASRVRAVYEGHGRGDGVPRGRLFLVPPSHDLDPDDGDE
ncbi:MAG: hypothetical protein M5U28_23155 [Sandaracinaceae bacterium]|nr:hypothetical protein [Sandaracinaceae bacterium]